MALCTTDIVKVIVLAAGSGALLRTCGTKVRGVSSPTKYGLNGTIPATVNINEGSCGMRLADGTTAWSFSAKKSRNDLRRPSADIDETEDNPD